MGSNSKFPAVIALSGVSVLILISGILLLYFAIDIHRTGWIDVVDSYYEDTSHTVITLIKVLGGFVIVLGFLGIAAAFIKSNVVLIAFAGLSAIFMILLLVVTVSGYLISSRADDWQGRPFPVNLDEVNIKNGFERAYCYAQGSFICNEIPLQATAGTMLSREVVATLIGIVGSEASLGSTCNQALNNPMITRLTGLTTACSGCSFTTQTAEYWGVMEWSNEQCPRTNDILIYCGSRLVTGMENTMVGANPYFMCRNRVLGKLEAYGNKLGSGALVGVFGALLAIGAALLLRGAKEESGDGYTQNPESHFF
ncbi:hypothetical protein ABG067_002262 [Albugo candida]|uniref:Tetraspanin n=1 Tax=Albugo candida TaxID=65357 RepID=A0A024FZD0_9STRA|nr:unnamed protein product [Albugo candida]|eukprot:CCI39929.1 unnamed protein product [Albugo candida]